MTPSEKRKEMIRTVKELFKEEDIDHFIGYKEGTYGLRTSPAFIEDAEEADKLTFSPLCSSNLVNYLSLERKNPVAEEEEKEGKVGVVVKGCDSRAVNQLLQEEGLDRDDLIILGVSCDGVIDLKKIEEKEVLENEEMDLERKGDEIVITSEGEEYIFSDGEILADECLGCEHPNPVVYDVQVGEEVDKREEEYGRFLEVEDMSTEERWDYWAEQFDACIRCYACREACPMCYCDECMAQLTEPQWIYRSINLTENTGWHLMRAMHLAGRCVGCGECERVCPMDIPIMELNKKLEKEVKEMYDHEAGMEPEGEPLFAKYRAEDEEDFIL